MEQESWDDVTKDMSTKCVCTSDRFYSINNSRGELRNGWRLANESFYSQMSESVAKGFVLKDN